MKRSSSSAVTASFAFSALVKAAFVASCGMQYALLGRAPVSLAEAQANDARQQAISFVSMPVALLATIVLFVWLYRAKKAALRLGMADAEYSPGLSVGCFFIPVLNFVAPFQAVRELWKASVNPVNWKQQRSSALVGWWWASWLATVVTSIAVLAYSRIGEGLGGLKVTTIWMGLSGMVAIVSYVLTIALARGISAQLNGCTELVAPEPPQRNAGSRPSSDDSPASETPSSLGPRG